MSTGTWFLSLIECTDGSIYAGITGRRGGGSAVHQSAKGACYMRSHPPARSLGFEAHLDRSSAAKSEWRIKQLTAAEKDDLQWRCKPSSHKKPPERRFIQGIFWSE